MILTPFLMDVAKVVAGMREDWPLIAIHRALCACEGRQETEIALAAVRVAADPQSKAPARIHHAGPWWLPCDLSDASPVKGVPMPDRYQPMTHRSVPAPEGWKDRVLHDMAAARAARPHNPTEETDA